MMIVVVTLAFVISLPGAFLLGFAVRPIVDKAVGRLFRWGWW